MHLKHACKLIFDLVLLSNASILTFSLNCFSIQMARKGLLVLRRRFCCCWFFVDSLLIVACIVWFCVYSMFCCTLLFCNHLDGEETTNQQQQNRQLVGLLCLAGGWDFYVALPHGAVGWSAVCECGIFWSYSLTCSYPSIILRFSKRVG